jgi:PTH1 family peptidyl-tRNA hydrolase
VADRCGASFRKAKRFIRAEVAEVRIAHHPTVLALPTTFMNESGQAVAPLLRYYGAEVADLLVVHDDIDLPFAKLRVAHDRGSGGNNGVQSIIGSVGASGFWRLKCGVGRPPGRMDPADHVLHRFSTAEAEDAGVMIQRAADVVERFVVEGGESARQLAGDLSAADPGDPR